MSDKQTGWTPPQDAVVAEETTQGWTPPQDGVEVAESNPWEAASNAIKSQANIDPRSAVVGGLYDLGRSAASAISDMLPQAVATQSGRQISESNQFINERLASPEGQAAYKQLHGEEAYQKMIASQPAEQAKVTDMQLGFERAAQTQKNEAAQKLSGVVQRVEDIKSASDVASYIGQAFGQAVGQIPMSVLSGGTSSFLLEAAAIYDEQLDQLSKIHNITREEVIARGLDKPAEGKVMAILAAGLDMFSAGQVMGMFRRGVQKELKESVIKSVLKGAAAEGITEGLQGNLEQFGATQGSGAKFEFDASRTVNEALAGAIGGGGLSAVSGTTPKPEEFNAIEKEISEESTGDPEIDRTIDDSAAEVARFVDNISEQVDGLSGAKIVEDFDKISNNALELEEQLNKALGRAGRAELLLDLNSRQIARTPEERFPANPQKEGEVTGRPVINEDGTIGFEENMPQESMIPDQIDQPVPKTKYVRGKKTTTQSVAPVSQPEIPTTPITFKTAKGSIYTVNKDGSTTRDKAARKEHLDSGPQKASDKTYYIDEQEFDNIQSKIQDGEKTVTLDKAVADPAVGLIPVEIWKDGSYHFGNKIVSLAPMSKAAPKIDKMATEEVEVVRPKKDKEHILDRLETKFANAMKRGTYPGRKISSLEKIRDAAEKAGLTEIAERADNELKVMSDSKIDKEDETITLGKSVAESASKELGEMASATEDQKNAIAKELNALRDAIQREDIKEVKDATERVKRIVRATKKELSEAAKEAKKASKKVNQKFGVKKGLVFKETISKDDPKAPSLKAIKNKYYDAMAQFTEPVKAKTKRAFSKEDIDSRNAIIAEYKAWRAENNLKPESDEAIERGYMTEQAQARGKKAIEDAGRQRTRDKKKAAKEAEDKDREAEEAARQELGEAFDIDPDEIGDIDEMWTFNKDLEDGTEEKYPDFYAGLKNKKEISFEEFAGLTTSPQQKILNALNKIIHKYKKKEDTKYFLVPIKHARKSGQVAGMHFKVQSDLKSYVLISVDAKTGKPIRPNDNDVLHEYVHEYTRLMFSRLYSTNKDFKEEIDKTFEKVRSLADKKILDVFTRIFTNKGTTTERDYDILIASQSFADVLNYNKISYAAKTTKEQIDLANKAKDDVIKGIYGFTNSQELLSEIFSNPQLVNLLSLIESDEKITSGIYKGQVKSLLYKWYEDLLDWTKKKFQYLSTHQEFSEFKSLADLVLDVVARFDEEFVEGNLPPKFQKIVDENTNKYYSDFSKTPKVPKIPKVKLNKEIMTNLFNTLRKRADIKTVEDVQAYINRVNSHLKPEKQLGEAYAHRLFNKINKEREKVKLAKQVQANAIAYAKAKPEYKTSYKYQLDVDGFSMVNIDDLNPETRAAYISGFGKLAHNGIPTKKEYDTMISWGLKQAAKTDMMPIAPKLHKTYITGLDHKTNAALFSSIISKFDSIVGDKVLKNIYAGLMKGFSKATTESTDLSRKVNRIADKNNLTHKDVAKVGMYGGIFSTETNPVNVLEWREEILRNVEQTIDSAQSKLLAYENGNYNGKLTLTEIKAELDAAKELEAAIQKDTRMDKVLSKGQQELYDAIREFSMAHENDFERNSIGIWGKKEYIPLFNYFPKITAGKAVGDFESSDIISERAKDLYSAVERSVSPDDTTVSGKSAKAKEARKNPKGYFYEYDATAIASKHSKDILLDMYTSAEFKKLNRLMKDNDFKKAMSPALIRSFTAQLKNISGAGHKFPTTYNGSWVAKTGRGLMKFRDNLYSSAIATSGQLLLQSISGVANAAVIVATLNPVKSGKNLAKALSAAGQVVYSGATDNYMNEFYNFMKEQGLGIQIRDVFFEKYFKPSEYTGRVSGILGNKASRLLGKTGVAFQTATEAPTRWGDKYAAAAVFFATYFDAGGTIEAPNRDAIIRAERMVGVLQNMSDVNFAAPMFRTDNKAWRHIMMMLYAFKSFALNSEIALAYSLKNSLNSPEARKIAVSQVASVMAYRTAQVFVISQAYGAIAKAIVGSDNGDDEEDKKNYKWWEEVMYQGLWDMLLGGYSPAFVDGAFRYWFNKNEGLGLFSPSDGSEFDQFKDSPLYSAKNKNDMYKGILGPGAGDIAEAIVETADLEISTFEKDGDWEKEAARKDKQGLWARMMVGLFVAGSTHFPLRGDFKRVGDKVIGKKKSDAFKAKQGASGGDENYDADILMLPDNGEEPEIQLNEPE